MNARNLLRSKVIVSVFFLWNLLQPTAASQATGPAALPPGGLVRLWTGSGVDTAADLYWGSGTAIWNNTGDAAYLRDAAGNLVATYTYP